MERIIDTNLTSLCRLSKPVLRAMMKKRNGRIISIGSVVGTMGNRRSGQLCCRQGRSGHFPSRWPGWRPIGITVNAVVPGFIETDMTKALNEEQRAGIMNQVPAARLGDPKEIAAAVVFLASDDAAAYHRRNPCMLMAGCTWCNQFVVVLFKCDNTPKFGEFRGLTSGKSLQTHVN